MTAKKITGKKNEPRRKFSATPSKPEASIQHPRLRPLSPPPLPRRFCKRCRPPLEVHPIPRGPCRESSCSPSGERERERETREERLRDLTTDGVDRGKTNAHPPLLFIPPPNLEPSPIKKKQDVPVRRGGAHHAPLRPRRLPRPLDAQRRGRQRRGSGPDPAPAAVRARRRLDDGRARRVLVPGPVRHVDALGPRLRRGPGPQAAARDVRLSPRACRCSCLAARRRSQARRWRASPAARSTARSSPSSA